jgi:hypothetical protein
VSQYAENDFLVARRDVVGSFFFRPGVQEKRRGSSGPTSG